MKPALTIIAALTVWCVFWVGFGLLVEQLDHMINGEDDK